MLKNNYSPGNKVTLLHSGEEYFTELLNVINTATTLLHLQVYILDEDTTGTKIIEALKAAALRGVEVYVMVDGFGSNSLSTKCIQQIKASGIHFRFFSPFPFSSLTQSGRRLHHKICVADNAIALIGGINIADKYSGFNQTVAWFDYAVKTEGIICANITALCESIWQRRFRKQKQRSVSDHATRGESLVRISRNDWLRRKNEISIEYKQKLRTAKKEIIIVASYFIPSRKLLAILIKAAKQKRSVSIILTRKSDVPFIKAATTYLYDKMLRNGIRIFEYKESVLHAKVCVVDEEWCTIGSHNLNHLSEFLSVETNVSIIDKKFAKSFANELKQVMKNHCIEITFDEHKKRATIFQRLGRWISFKLVGWSIWILNLINWKDTKK